MDGRSFTVRFPGGSSVLVTDVAVFSPFESPERAPSTEGVVFRALWDTGATNTVITQKVVDALDLKLTGFAESQHAHGKVTAETYHVNIGLPNGVGVRMVQATKGDLGYWDLLIGMDIIALGDFAVTNNGRETAFSFRVPSSANIDFTTEDHTPVRHPMKVGRNEPCPCGSDKKYKNCHGRG
ncbi:MAG TPA: SEC-C metal-binding domain-containing protein [Thermoanaerobaculaceae bacterium]|nr:SEC-C metal-binding domain-containing protein [Thermoanaerobaculaceae bacterium]